ncbi:Mechanosensitive ion channel-domain-containing protein [Gaertneriomyces semiglobifer]|nr:Mechanosensitive ion channel-domain-containing protein [Gaertneriomyces semiglobifer]
MQQSHMRRHLPTTIQYVVAVRGSLTVACWAIITVIAYGSLFNQMRKVDYWTDIFHVIVTAMVFCILYLVQKLLLQMIAVKFHRVAYKDRIVQSKKGMKIVEALRKAVKNRGLFVPAELNLMRSRLLKRPKSFPDATALATQGDSLYHDSHAPEATGGRKAAPFWRSVGRRKAPRGEITRSLEALNLGVSSMGNASDVHLHEDVLKSASLVPKPDDVTASQPIYLAQPESATEALPPEMPIPELVRQPSIERQPPLNLGADGEGQGASSPAARSRRTSTNRKGLDAETASLGAKSTRSMHLPRLATMLRRTSKVGAAEAVAEEPPVVETPAPPPVIRPAVLLRDLRGSKYIKQFARMDATGHVQAGKLARKIFGALGGYEQEALQPKDFEPCFSDPQDAVEAFALMDQDGNGSVTKKELKESIVGIYREHRRLARAMRDLSHVIGKLDIFFTCITCFITFCVALPVFGISLTAMLPFTSFILALSFVFGTAARTAFECLLFLFVTHPYDAGDRVFIDNQSLFVEEVGVLTTVFRRLDGQLIYAPNPLLQSKLIHNIRRSRDQSEAIEIQVIFDTPEDKLKTLHQKMIEYVKSEPREFQPVCDMHILDIENQNKVKLSFILKHKGNWQDGSKRWNRRTMFMYALKRELVALDIKYMMPPPYKAPDPVPPVGEANAQTTASTVPTIVLTGSQVIPQPLAGAANMTAGVP